MAASMNRVRSILSQLQMSQQRSLVFSRPRQVNQEQSSLSKAEINRDSECCNNGKYIKKELYDSLSALDKDSLNKILFTFTGYYALNEKYISVDEFLSIPLEARKYLSYFFYNAEETYWEAQNCREMIDRIFKGKYFNIKEFASLPDDRRKNLIRFLCLNRNLGISSIEEGCLTMNEFLTLNLKQQDELLNTFNNYLDRMGNSYTYSAYKDLLDKITVQMTVFKSGNEVENLSGKKPGY